MNLIEKAHEALPDLKGYVFVAWDSNNKPYIRYQVDRSGPIQDSSIKDHLISHISTIIK